MDFKKHQGGNENHIGEHINIGIITVSDRAFNGEYVDEGGPKIIEFFSEVLATPWTSHSVIIPDIKVEIEKQIIELTDEMNCSLVVTTGGTGPTKRDVTPDATIAIADKELPGFGELMRAISLKYVPTAILSRQVGVIRGNSLIINLPGQPKAIRETIDEIFPAIPYCIDLIEGPYIDTKKDTITVFRPKNAKR
ncbi:MAG: molybdopterin adenylyltransferase [Euryarchaeota archaeon]|nr:molybdopterin adenylyltransferase [Euryarchaeota archaeon]|tara:strand:+ start:1725 stop:2306 length:582 start_codon:yes stop_codon:yes gene_type:complete